MGEEVEGTGWPFVARTTAMGRVRKVTGEDVLSEDEFAAWWSESEHLQGSVFIDVLRRHLARQLQVVNFRQLGRRQPLGGCGARGRDLVLLDGTR